MKVGVIDVRGGAFDMECHAADCKDLKKKWQYEERKWFADSVEEAKKDYEADNWQFEEEGGVGYSWNDMVRVFPCVGKVGE
jgi:hypothetical protein